MPVDTVPLVGPETRRGYGINVSTSKDQYFQGALIVKPVDEATKSALYYLQKRPGVVNAGVAGTGIGTAIFLSPSTGSTVLAYGGTNSTIVLAGIASGGAITGVTNAIIETIISGTTYFLMVSDDGTGWYLVWGAVNQTAYTGDTSNGSPAVTNIASTAGMYSGQAISGSGIPVGTRILTVNSSTQITLNANATATASGVALTKTPVAKILDADFPSAVGQFAEMDGYVFALTSTGRIYNSDPNSVTSWNSLNYIEANIKTDVGVNLIRHQNHIVCWGASSLEFFYNAGNAAGSVLSSRKELFRNIGMYSTAQTKKFIQIQDQVFWIGNDLCLYTFDGFAPVNLNQQGMTLGGISVPPSGISGFISGDDIIISVVSSTAARDKWFSLKNRLFFEPSLGVSEMIWVPDTAASTATMAYGVSRADTGGELFSLSSSVFLDDSSAFSMVVQTQPYVLNKGKPFTVKSVRLIGDNQSGGTIALRTNNNDYDSSSWTTRDSFDKTDLSRPVYRCGFYKNHLIMELTDSHNSACRLQAAEVEWEPAAGR